MRLLYTKKFFLTVKKFCQGELKTFFETFIEGDVGCLHIVKKHFDNMDSWYYGSLLDETNISCFAEKVFAVMKREEVEQDLKKAGTRLWRATGYSLVGLRAAFQNEQAFRQESYILLIVVPLALWWGDGAVEKVLLIGSWLIVMIAELLNSAVEAVVDRISDESHELSGRAKDIASAAVMVALALVVLTWILLLF